MLGVLNRYTRGFVVVSVVLSRHTKGVFKALVADLRTGEQLANELGADLGHLRFALHLLDCLGWTNRRSEECLEATR